MTARRPSGSAVTLLARRARLRGGPRLINGFTSDQRKGTITAPLSAQVLETQVFTLAKSLRVPSVLLVLGVAASAQTNVVLKTMPAIRGLEAQGRGGLTGFPPAASQTRWVIRIATMSSLGSEYPDVP